MINDFKAVSKTGRDDNHEQYQRKPFKAQGIYIRQSSLAQVEHLQESTRRQYRLYERALRLRWPKERIEIIDEDQGKCGASAQMRSGFTRLVSEVALERVGGLDFVSALNLLVGYGQGAYFF